MTGKWLTLFFLFLSMFTTAQPKINLADDSLVIVGNISFLGNKITKDKIIRRELEFHQGDTLSKTAFQQKIKKSRENLINRSLFNFVTFTIIDSGNKKNITISFIERWYIWPIPILDFADRNINAWWQTKDFSRINYGIDLRVDNFRGRMELLHIILQNGFDKAVGVQWEIPYVNKKQKFGISFSTGLVFSKETDYNTIDNKPVFYGPDNGFAKKLYFAEIGFSYRGNYNIFHSLLLTYNNLVLNDSLLVLNPSLTYGQTLYNYFNLFYKLKIDYRDYKPYPLNGYYFDVQFNKMGFGVLSDMNSSSLELNFDHYFNIYRRLFFAYRLAALYTIDKKLQPYIVTKGMELGDLDMRGYQLFVINGQKIGLLKSNLKFEIIPMKTHRIKWIKNEKFGKLFYALYANLFFDSGYVSDSQTGENNPLANQYLWATGLGLDFVSFYDIVIRLEYTINKQKQTGVYVGLVASI